jgi:hypothetical protein
VNIVASIATVHGVGNVCLHSSSAWRVAGSLPSDNTVPLTSFTQKLIVFLWMSKPIYVILGIEEPPWMSLNQPLATEFSPCTPTAPQSETTYPFKQLTVPGASVPKGSEKSTCKRLIP